MESANAAIRIGGKISRSDLAELAAALAEDHAALDWTDTLAGADLVADLEARAAAGENLAFYNVDQPWGQYETTQAFCRQHGLTYVLEYEAGGDWGPGLEYRSPHMEPGQVRTWPNCEIGDGPMVDAQTVQRWLDAGVLADELALMIAAHKFPWPLKIVG